MPGITVIGLGPGHPKYLTLEAWDLLRNAEEVYVRTLQHPTLAVLPATVRVHSFDAYYERAKTFEEVYQAIVDTLLDLAHCEEGVLYAVPGHPFVGESTTRMLRERAQAEGLPFRVVEGVSFLEPVFRALGVDPLPHTAVVDALELARLHIPPFPPNTPAVIAQMYARHVASNVKLTLMSLYPDEHPVYIVHRASMPDETVKQVPLYALDRDPDIGLLTAVYVPPLDYESAFEALQEVVARLRAPDGCPWDRKQTHKSLRPYLLEEAYEVLDALDRDDPQALQEELGDLLLQILMHTQIATEAGEFTMPDVLRYIHRKMVRRHPHVFGQVKVNTAEEVLQNWEKIKKQEQAQKGEAKSVLEGVGKTLPALARAQAVQRKAADFGFDWKDIEGVWAKLEEELEEVRRARTPEEREREIGDAFFALVNLARWYNVDAESALRETVTRFLRRFHQVERRLAAQGRDLNQATFEELDALWEAVKHEDVSD